MTTINNNLRVLRPGAVIDRSHKQTSSLNAALCCFALFVVVVVAVWLI